MYRIYTFLGWLVGVPYYLIIRLLALTCKIEYVGEENYRSVKNCILASWHQYNIPFFLTFQKPNSPTIWINYNAPYMKMVHPVLYLLGVNKLALYVGKNGRKAADAVIEHLKQGYSTHLNPDGPYGPIRVAKKGALHMTSKSGVPIVPVSILCSNAILFRKTWDIKRLPLPFSKITVYYGEPLYNLKVDQQSLDKLTLALNYKLN